MVQLSPMWVSCNFVNCNLCVYVSLGIAVSRRVQLQWHERSADKPYCVLLHESRFSWHCGGVCHITWHQPNVWWGASTWLDCIKFYDKRVLWKSKHFVGSLVTSSGNWHTDLFEQVAFFVGTCLVLLVFLCQQLCFQWFLNNSGKGVLAGR